MKNVYKSAQTNIRGEMQGGGRVCAPKMAGYLTGHKYHHRTARGGGGVRVGNIHRFSSPVMAGLEGRRMVVVSCNQHWQMVLGREMIWRLQPVLLCSSSPASVSFAAASCCSGRLSAPLL